MGNLVQYKQMYFDDQIVDYRFFLVSFDRLVDSYGVLRSIDKREYLPTYKINILQGISL